MPKPQAQSSRRNFVRVTLPKTFKVEFNGEMFDAFDLSVYGLSFLVDPASPVTGSLKAGQVLSPLLFQVGDRTLTLDARVTYVEQMKNGRYKVGVEFLQIGPSEVFFLSSFIVKRRRRSPLRVKVRLRASPRKKAARKSTKKKTAKKKTAKKAPKKKKTRARR